MSTWNGTLPTILGGDLPDGNDWDQILDALEAISGPWTTYTPVWTSTGTAPAIGDGTLDGRYLQVSRLIITTGRLLMGASTTYGTGAYRITLPVSATSTTQFAGAALIFDSSSGAAQTPGVARIADAPRLRFYGPTGEVAATTPFTWAAGDQIVWSMTYMRA